MQSFTEKYIDILDNDKEVIDLVEKVKKEFSCLSHNELKIEAKRFIESTRECREIFELTYDEWVNEFRSYIYMFIIRW